MYARWRNNLPCGRTVLKNSGIYTTLDNPTVDQVNSADIAYLGGHIYYISDAEAAALTAAGYTTTPDIFSLYPLLTLYPSETLYPGFQEVIYP